MPGRWKWRCSTEDSLFGVHVSDTNWPYKEKGWDGFSLPVFVYHPKRKRLQRLDSTGAAGEGSLISPVWRGYSRLILEFKLSLQVHGKVFCLGSAMLNDEGDCI